MAPMLCRRSQAESGLCRISVPDVPDTADCVDVANHEHRDPVAISEIGQEVAGTMWARLDRRVIHGSESPACMRSTAAP